MNSNESSAAPTPRGVAAERGVAWVTEAWAIFMKMPGFWLVLSLISLGVAAVCSIMPLVGNLLMQFVLALLAAGWMLVARKQREGGTPEVGDLFAILSHPALTRLLIATLIYVALTFAAFMIVMLVFGLGAGALALGGGLVGGDSAAMAAGLGAVALGALVLLAVLVPIIAMYWFAVPLVLFRNMEPWPAMLASISAVLANVVPMLVYGLISLLIPVFLVVTLGLGVVLVFPVVVLSWYISYEDIYP